MDKKIERLEGQLPLEFEPGEKEASAILEWYQDVGRAVVSLEKMCKAPTEIRPFVYDLRLDLMALRQGVGLVVAKGFGKDGSLITFQDCAGLISGLVGLEGRFRAGKVTWQEDKYPTTRYEEKVALYLGGTAYRLD